MSTMVGLLGVEVTYKPWNFNDGKHATMRTMYRVSVGHAMLEVMVSTVALVHSFQHVLGFVLKSKRW